MMVLPPLSQYFVDNYGLRGTLLLLSGLIFNGCVAAALMQRPKQTVEYSIISRVDDMETNTNANDKHNRKNKTDQGVSFWNHILKHFQVELFVEMPIFTVYQTIFALYAIGIATWVVFLVPHGISKGIPAEKAVFLSTIGGLGTIVGRIGHGPLVDYDIIRDDRLFGMLSLMCGITFLVDPLIDSLAILCVLAFIAGTALGARYPLSMTMTKKLVDDDHFVSAMGWTHFFTGLGKAVGGALTGKFCCQGGWTRLPKFKFSAKFPVGLHVVL